MSGFSDILKQGKKRFEVKSDHGSWGRCEYCDERHLLHSYHDNKNEIWKLCDQCTDFFVKEEDEGN